MRRALLVCWIVMPTTAAAAVAAAPTTRLSPATAATRPVTQSATQPADLSTPKAALRALAGALRSGEPRELAHVVACGNETERQVVAVMADTSAALASLRHAAVSAYGEHNAGKFAADPDVGYKESVARIEAAEVVISSDGDTATVRYPGADQPEYVLVRASSDGKWRIPATQFSKGADAAALERRLSEARLQVQIVREIAREIAAGKYKNAETAKEAWQSKIMQALGPRPPGAGGTTRRS